MSDSKDMREATPEELAQTERRVQEGTEMWMRSFFQFPTKHNLEGVVEAMWAYQLAWMNGRKRPDQ